MLQNNGIYATFSIDSISFQLKITANRQTDNFEMFICIYSFSKISGFFAKKLLIGILIFSILLIT